MNELDNDFIKFHDQIILENAQLKSKLEALEDFVKSSFNLLFETQNYNQLLKEYILKELQTFDGLSRNTQVYDSRSVQNIKRDYLWNLRKQIDDLK